MNDLVALPKIAQWQKLKMLVLDSVSSPITKRVYNMALDEFYGWFQQAPRPGFTKATVSAWRVSLEARGLGCGSVDVARYHAAADRVFRAAGNHAGRGRLDSTTRLREPKPPRALILSTGEEIPRGQSVRARLLILEVSKGSINNSALAECQRDALAGLYAASMAGYLQWLAGRYDQARAGFEGKVSEHRSEAMLNAAHARTPEILASLQAAFELYLEFCVKSDAIDVLEAGRLADRCWEALCEAAASQAKHQAETEPTARFLSLLRSLLSSGRAHLEERAGGAPDQAPGSCGWRQDSSGNWMPLGDCIGWVDGDQLYLEPTAAFRAALMAARDSGESFAISDRP